jgi:DNA-directed RNA polymerase specialized sigma24 family protein
MKLLNAEQRRFVICLYRDGQTQTAIAQLVGTTQGNISRFLARARRRDASIPIRRGATNRGAAELQVFASSQIGSSKEPFNLDNL